MCTSSSRIYKIEILRLISHSLCVLQQNLSNYLCTNHAIHLVNDLSILILVDNSVLINTITKSVDCVQKDNSTKRWLYKIHVLSIVCTISDSSYKVQTTYYNKLDLVIVLIVTDIIFILHDLECKMQTT